MTGVADLDWQLTGLLVLGPCTGLNHEPSPSNRPPFKGGSRAVWVTVVPSPSLKLLPPKKRPLALRGAPSRFRSGALVRAVVLSKEMHKQAKIAAV